MRFVNVVAAAGLVAVAASMPAGPVGAVDRPAASAQAAVPDGALLEQGMVLGGTYGGVTYDSLWSGRGPVGSVMALYVPPTRRFLDATAFFGNWPTYGPDGRPISGPVKTTYQWIKTGCTPVYTVALTPATTRSVPVDPGGHVTSVPAPTLAVSAHLPLDPTCDRIGIQFFQPPRQTDYSGLDFVWLTRTPPANLPNLDAQRDAQGRVILYTVAPTGEVTEVQRSGRLLAKPEGVLRYFFTNCESARVFRGSMLEAGRDAAGIVRVPGASDIVEKFVGVTAKQSGARDLTAWGYEEATGAVWDQAQVVAKGKPNPTSDCRL